MSGAAQALQGAVDLLTKFYESPSLAHSKALVLIDAELPKLRKAIDNIDYTEKGLAEWRATALSNGRQAEAARATARIAIKHLQAVVKNSPLPIEDFNARCHALDWLLSIGHEAR